MKIRIITSVIAAMFLPLVAVQAAFVWIEAETTYKSNMPQNPWAKGDNPKLLSAGDAFAGQADNRESLPNPAFLLYKVTISEDGSYFIYLRHGYCANMGEMRIRFVALDATGKPVKPPGAEEGWTKIDWEVPVVDRIAIGQYRTIEWSKQEAVNLKKGNYIMDVQFTGPNAHQNGANPPTWGLLDVFCLTTEPFTPRGTLKPGEEAKAPEAGKAGGSYN